MTAPAPPRVAEELPSQEWMDGLEAHMDEGGKVGQRECRELLAALQKVTAAQNAKLMEIAEWAETTGKHCAELGEQNEGDNMEIALGYEGEAEAYRNVAAHLRALMVKP